MDLVALEEIRQLKYRYFRTLDLKEWDAFGDCLAEDINARYGTQAMPEPLHFDSRADVVAYMEALQRSIERSKSRSSGKTEPKKTRNPPRRDDAGGAPISAREAKPRKRA